jgi:hypothetical protein
MTSSKWVYIRKLILNILSKGYFFTQKNMHIKFNDKYISFAGKIVYFINMSMYVKKTVHGIQ